MKLWHQTLLIFVLFLPVSAFCQESIDCKLQANFDRLTKSELSIQDNKNKIISFLILNSSKNNLKIAHNYLNKNKDDDLPLLLSLYLNASIKNGFINNDSFFNKLMEYKNLEPDNSAPYYLLACYFDLKKNHKLCMQYLSEGNKKKYHNRHLREKTDIVINFLLGQEEELIAYYSQIYLYSVESYQVYRKLSQSMLKSELNESAGGTMGTPIKL